MSPVAPKHAVAIEHLSNAIELYLRGDAYYSALHLGGAAEEILKIYCRAVTLEDGTRMRPTFDQFKEAVLRVSAPSTPDERLELEKWIHDRMTGAKNSVKHKMGNKDEHVDFDAKEEAYEVIDRAISTYFQLQAVLQLPYVFAIREFDARRRQEQWRSEA